MSQQAPVQKLKHPSSPVYPLTVQAARLTWESELAHTASQSSIQPHRTIRRRKARASLKSTTTELNDQREVTELDHDHGATRPREQYLPQKNLFPSFHETSGASSPGLKSREAQESHNDTVQEIQPERSQQELSARLRDGNARKYGATNLITQKQNRLSQENEVRNKVHKETFSPTSNVVSPISHTPPTPTPHLPVDLHHALAGSQTLLALHQTLSHFTFQLLSALPFPIPAPATEFLLVFIRSISQSLSPINTHLNDPKTTSDSLSTTLERVRRELEGNGDNSSCELQQRICKLGKENEKLRGRCADLVQGCSLLAGKLEILDKRSGWEKFRESLLTLEEENLLEAISRLVGLRRIVDMRIRKEVEGFRREKVERDLRGTIRDYSTTSATGSSKRKSIREMLGCQLGKLKRSMTLPLPEKKSNNEKWDGRRAFMDLADVGKIDSKPIATRADNEAGPLRERSRKIVRTWSALKDLPSSNYPKKTTKIANKSPHPRRTTNRTRNNQFQPQHK